MIIKFYNKGKCKYDMSFIQYLKNEFKDDSFKGSNDVEYYIIFNKVLYTVKFCVYKNRVYINNELRGTWFTNDYIRKLVAKIHSKESFEKRKESIGYPILITYISGVSYRYVSLVDASNASKVPYATLRRICYGTKPKQNTLKKHGILSVKFCD